MFLCSLHMLVLINFWMMCRVVNGMTYSCAACSQDQSFEKLRRIYEISSILNDVVDALLKEAEPEDASRLQDTDVSSFQL